MKLSKLWPAATILLLAAAVMAAEPAADRIVILQVEITASSATLVDATIVDGHLKQPRHVEVYPGMLQIEVYNGDATRIYQAVTEDPMQEVLEWADESGKLQSKVIEKDTAIAYVRLPYQQAAGMVTVSRVIETAGEHVAKQVAAQPLGSFNANWTEVADDK